MHQLNDTNPSEISSKDVGIDVNVEKLIRFWD